MRKLVLAALLLVFVGAFGAAWLSSSTPSGSPIGDVNLAEERIPGSGTNGFGVPPRQAPTSPARSSLAVGGSRSAATTPDSSIPIPEMTIASSNPLPGSYDAPTASRRTFSSGGTESFRSMRQRRANSSSSGGGAFSALGFGTGGVGGGGGGATAAPRNGAPADRTTPFTTDATKKPAVTPAPAAQRPSAPRPPSGGGGGGGGSDSGSGGGSSSSAPAPVGAAAEPAAAAALAVPPSPGIAAIVPAEPGPSPAVIPPFEGVSPGGSPSPAATPEPTTMLLLGTGIAGLYRLRRYLE